jgi:general secretion pathway protein J
MNNKLKNLSLRGAKRRSNRIVSTSQQKTLSSGFTLIEVLISLAIFTVVGLATVKHIQLIQNTKNSAFEDLDLYNNVRAALSLLRSDLTQSFHILYDDLGTANKAALLRNQQLPHTLFDGRKKELVFTSLSHRNYYAGKRECEQTEISYFLVSKGKAKYPTLTKRESEFIDADLYHGGELYSLVDNVVELEFKFWDEKTGKWVDEWNSDNGGTRDRFPFEIKVKLKIIGENEKLLEVENKIKVANPNNLKFVVQF